MLRVCHVENDSDNVENLLKDSYIVCCINTVTPIETLHKLFIGLLVYFLSLVVNRHVKMFEDSNFSLHWLQPAIIFGYFHVSLYKQHNLK